VVEVLSPRESKRKLKQKLVEYFANGTSLAWVVNPKERHVQVYSSAEHFKTLRENDRLDGAMVLPGFKFALKQLFAVPNFGE
jgi:Uma2 family endonuclease